MIRLSRLLVPSVVAMALAACHGPAGSGGSLPPTGLTPATGSQSETIAVPETIPSNAVQAYIHLPLRNSGELDKLIEQQSTKGSPLYHHWITPAQFRASFGPTTSDLNAAAAALKSEGFTTTMTSQGIIADAPQAVVQRAFGIELMQRSSPRNPGVTSLVATRPPVVPQALARLGAHIDSFASLPFLRPNYAKVSGTLPNPKNRYSPWGGYWFTDLKQAYTYPSYAVANGAGMKIALLEVSNVRAADQAIYFGFNGVPAPTVIVRKVDGGPPPFDPTSGLSVEATLDVQQAGGSAPKATILLYGAPTPTFSAFLDMYTAVVEDDKADVVSTSFGACELEFTPPYNGGQDFTYILKDFHDVFRQGNAQGITFVNSSGDSGAYGCPNVANTHVALGVQIWGDDPAVTSVGGTNLETSYIKGSLRSTYVSENAYYDRFAASAGELPGAIWGSGGGKSVVWGKPVYQTFVDTHSSTRSEPDLAMHMGGCPFGAVTPCSPDRSFDWAVFAGQFIGLIGTSASSPEFAGLLALQDEMLGARAGNANFIIYALAAEGSIGNGPIFHNHIPGNNGYPATPGYNFVVGNGTPHGAQFAVDPYGPFAGDPNSPTNP